MDTEKRKHFSPPAIGGTSLLVVFAVLCLTIFALLSLATVQANRRLADASNQAITDYYAADCQAQEILARLRRGEVPEGVDLEGDCASYVCPISDTLELQVRVQLDWLLLDMEPDEHCGYTVLRWKTAPSGNWQGDDGLELWDGDGLELWGGDGIMF